MTGLDMSFGLQIGYVSVVNTELSQIACLATSVVLTIALYLISKILQLALTTLCFYPSASPSNL